MAPGGGRGHLCWGSLIFKKNFLICFIGSVGFGDHFTDSSFAIILFDSARFEGDCSSGPYQQIVKKYAKILFYINS